jgi:itaconyl-CoA hydratase
MESLDTVNAAMIHYDAHYSAQTSWKLPLVVSTITLQALMGLSSKTFARRQRVTRFDSIAMTSPVFGGDTLYAESEVLDKRDSKSRPTAGVVTVRTRGRNQHGAVICEFERSILIAKRGFAVDDPKPAAADGTGT